MVGKSGIALMKRADESRKTKRKTRKGRRTRKTKRDREKTEERVSNTARAGTLMAKLSATVSVISS